MSALAEERGQSPFRKGDCPRSLWAERFERLEQLERFERSFGGMMSDEVRFIDTTLRDGNQSLWALNMRVGAMLAIAGQMDQAGFESMEFFVTAMFKKYVREHKENPWDWL